MRLTKHIAAVRLLAWAIRCRWSMLLQLVRILRLSAYEGKDRELMDALHQFYVGMYPDPVED